LIRHTEVHNPQDILYARLPRFRISELGRKQAEATALALAEEEISTIYTSPRLRARQTAHALAVPHPHARVRVTNLLDEVLTAWQGRPHAELEARGFNFYDEPLDPSDETLEQIWQRLDRFVRRVRRRHAGENVVGVTHGDVVLVARTMYLRMPLVVPSLRLPNLYPGHGSITRLTFPSNEKETYPLSVEYYDPNSQRQPWSEGWVRLEVGEGLKIRDGVPTA
jgi:broad specificity phosphatase PhoE